MSIVTEQELKAGHLPAEKVGGRRIPNKKDRRASETERTSSESSEDALREIEKDTTLIAQMEHSYPTSAVRTIHDKPVTQHPNHYSQNPPSHVRSTNQVFQPRKHN